MSSDFDVKRKEILQKKVIKKFACTLFFSAEAKRYQRHEQLNQKITSIVHDIIEHLTTFLFGSKNFMRKFAAEMAFLFSTIAVVLGNQEIIQKAIALFIDPAITIATKLKKELQTQSAILLYCASSLCEYDDGKRRSRNIINLRHLTSQSTIGENSPDYHQMLINYVNAFLESWVIEDARLNIEYIHKNEVIQRAVEFMESKWDDMEEKLEFYKNGKLTDRRNSPNRHKIFFATHVLFMANFYGTVPINQKAMTIQYQQKMLRLLCKWVDEFDNADRIERNIEEFSEICYSMLFLNNSTGCQSTTPSRVWTQANRLCSSAGDIKSKKKEYSWYPRDEKYTAYTDYHTLMVVATFLVEVLRYKRHLHPTSISFQDCPTIIQTRVSVNDRPSDLTVLETLDSDKSENFEKLSRDGFVFISARNRESELCENLASFSDIFSKRFRYLHDVIIRVLDPPVVIAPSPRQEELKRGVQLPSNFWEKIRHMVASALAIEVGRITIIPDQTFVRMQSSATKAQADFYPLVSQTDVFTKIRRHEGDYSKESKLCVICLQETGEEFKHMALCKNCARGCLPVFTASVTLGESHKSVSLEFIPGSHNFLRHGDIRQINEKEVIGNRWVYSTKQPVTHCDLLVYNCKTIYRYKPLENTGSGPYISVDVRFIIRPKI